MTATHPREVLLAGVAGLWSLPACDHYSGVEDRMRKSLARQAQALAQQGVCPFDVTLDLEDGAAAGNEHQQALCVVDLALSAQPGQRVAVRVHAVDHPSFEDDVQTVVGAAGGRLCHVMVPKVESIEDIERAVRLIDQAGSPQLPVHVLVESARAVQQVSVLARHPRVQSVSFGLMDFVSSHEGAIPASAMGLPGQFEHPLVVRAKLEISAACHAAGKVPSHCVVTELRDVPALTDAARRARGLGFTRMWSIHPSQIDPVVSVFSPEASEVEEAARVLLAAAKADWGPVSVDGLLHDRASYRYYWQVLQRAQRAGQVMNAGVQPWFH